MPWTTLCTLDELRDSEGKYVEIDRWQLAVFRVGEDVRVIDNWCPHAGGSLAGGAVEGGCVYCPWHGWPFRLSDGEMPTQPGFAVKTYTVRLLDGDDGKPPFVQADL